MKINLIALLIVFVLSSCSNDEFHESSFLLQNEKTINLTNDSQNLNITGEHEIKVHGNLNDNPTFRLTKIGYGNSTFGLCNYVSEVRCNVYTDEWVYPAGPKNLKWDSAPTQYSNCVVNFDANYWYMLEEIVPLNTQTCGEFVLFYITSNSVDDNNCIGWILRTDPQCFCVQNACDGITISVNNY